MPSSRPRLADVARAVGVSAMTVSNVLNGRPGVAEATRQRVLESARALGYTPNLQARALAGGRTRMIGLITHDLTVQYAWEVVRGIADELADVGYELLISATYQDASRERDRILFLADGVVDGLLLLAPVLAPDAHEALTSARIPAVVVDPRRELVGVPRVRAQNYDGARAATTHLLTQGHRRIGFITGHPSFDSSAERLAGYRDALAAAGADQDPKLIADGDYTQLGGFAATTNLLELADPPTAIFATADVAAFGAIDAITARGLRVPDDVSVVGFDDIPQAAQTRPALTTARQPLADMGQAGARMLLGLLRGEAPLTEDLRLPTHLVIRHSTAAPARKRAPKRRTSRPRHA